MKLKIFALFLLVLAAIGQTIFLNIDAKINFLQEKQNNNYTLSIGNESEKNSVQLPEVVVTIRQHETVDTSFEVEENTIFTPLEKKKSCIKKTEEERLICQKAKEAAKQNRVSGSNHLKSSTIQNP